MLLGLLSCSGPTADVLCEAHTWGLGWDLEETPLTPSLAVNSPQPEGLALSVPTQASLHRWGEGVETPGATWVSLSYVCSALSQCGAR